jgi:microcystin degradation protein MlrC
VRHVGIAGLSQETNTYSIRPTSFEDFQALELVRGRELETLHRGVRSVIGGMLDHPAFTSVPLISASAWPAGRVTVDALEIVLGLLDSELETAKPLDGLLLHVHGAMVAEGTDDVEREVVERVRRSVGRIPIAAVLDLHGIPSPEFVRLCDAVIGYDTYPHVDMYERGYEAGTLMQQMLDGHVLRTVIRKVPLLSTPLSQATDQPPMRLLQDLAQELGGSDVRVSLLPGFPYSDVARAGFSILAVAEEDALQKAEAVAARLAEEVEHRSDQFVVERPDPETAVAQALAAGRRPVILVDVADNVGGGSPGDGTTLLTELLRQQADGAIVQLADAQVVETAASLGAGATIRAEIGGKVDRRHGSPVPIEGMVMRVVDGTYRSQGTWMTGRSFSMGTTALIDVEGIRLVVTENAVPPFHAEQLQTVGLDPRVASVIVVKSAIAWRSAYGDIAAEVIEVDTPGICPVDPSVLDRETVAMRV